MTTRKDSAFLFDLDGTLIDSVYQHVLAWREALEAEGIDIPVWSIHRKIGMSGGLFARALLRETVRQFRRTGVQIIRYKFLQSPSSPRQADLRSLGFFYRKGRSSKLLVKFADGGLHEAAKDIVNWSYIIGDGEASFWLR